MDFGEVEADSGRIRFAAAIGEAVGAGVGIVSGKIHVTGAASGMDSANAEVTFAIVRAEGVTTSLASVKCGAETSESQRGMTPGAPQPSVPVTLTIEDSTQATQNGHGV